MYRRPRERTVKELELKGLVIIPYCNAMLGRVGRLLGKPSIQTIYQPAIKIDQIVGSVKDDLKLRYLVCIGSLAATGVAT